MSDNSAEGEASGLHALGNKDVEYRTSEGGQSGEGPLGQRVPSGVMARGIPNAAPRRGLGGTFQGKESLRKASSR